MRSVLIVSNGHGEDTVGALLSGELARRGFRISGYPLVGTGDAYHGVPLLEPRVIMPSGGFALRAGPGLFVRELRAGGLRLWRAQRRTLREQTGAHDLVVAVGDVYCLWMAAHADRRVTLVATAKSAYNESYGIIEQWLLRRRAAAVFTRDRPTADTLSARSIPARYEGNALMDAIPAPQAPLPLSRGSPLVVLLPGSRSDGLHNLLLLLKVALRVNTMVGAAFVCAIPPTLPAAEIVRGATAAGWETDGPLLRLGQTSVRVTRDFGSALSAAAVTVGLAGTANEQAAGMAIPVVAFAPPRAVQFTPRFLALQRRLLGDALVTSDGWESAAAAVVRLLRNPAERAHRGEVGRSRMGGGGAIPRIAESLLRMVGG